MIKNNRNFLLFLSYTKQNHNNNSLTIKSQAKTNSIMSKRFLNGRHSQSSSGLNKMAAPKSSKQLAIVKNKSGEFAPAGKYRGTLLQS